MTQLGRAFIRALLYGSIGTGLFRCLDYPGANTHFIDPRSLEKIMASGEFEKICNRVLKDRSRGTLLSS